MGFGGLMTNSYILHSRRKQEALDKGIHSLLTFDGVFMTDSGGYQVLEYGDLEVEYADVAAFQANIGSEVAVTLDRPTGYPQSRSIALETVEYSYKNAASTLKEFGATETVWVGPIQGGLYLDLVRRSARSLIAAGFEFLALGSPVQVMENYMFADLVKMIMAARSAIPYSIPLHLFGAGHPLTMSLTVALGCDTFDSASYIIFARSGRYMTRGGVLTLQAMKYLPCSCPVCSRESVKSLLELEHTERTRLLATHNLWVLREELEACKEAISEGRLWDLVEERSMAHPRLREAFLELSHYSDVLETGTPQIKDRGLFVRSSVDLMRPEVLSAQRRLARASKRSSKTAYLGVPAGAKPKPRPKTGQDVYVQHPVLGPVPIELQFQYPFSQTEVGAFVPTLSVKESKRRLAKAGYQTVRAEAEEEKVTIRSRRTRRGASPSPR
jgi:7-cyano-7-deazaguanine tRNA-ribosyltransferase